MGGSTAVHVHPATPTVAPSSWSVAAATRRRIGVSLAVVGALAATVVVLSITSTVVARLG